MQTQSDTGEAGTARHTSGQTDTHTHECEVGYEHMWLCHNVSTLVL